MAKPETLQELRALILESEGFTKSQVYFRYNQLGREPITGERILKALGKKGAVWRMKPKSEDAVEINIETDCGWERISWTLCQPAQEQSEEDIQKIIKLLK